MSSSAPPSIPAHLKARFEALDRPSRPLELGARIADADARMAVGRALGAGLDFAVLDLWGPGQDPDRDDVTPTEPALTPAVWAKRVVARGAPGAGYAAALGWVRHAGLSAVVLPLVADDLLAAATALGRVLAARETPGPAVWVEVPWRRDGLEAWRRVAAMVDYDPEVSVCLRIQGRPPKAPLLEAWRRQIPACLAFDAPSVGAPMQAALTALFSGRTKRVYFVGVPAPEVRADVQSCFDQVWSGVPTAAQIGVDHRDALIDPVQPLRDHIGAAIYLNFEEVAPKYEAYQSAVERALRARKDARPVRIGVLGAGRGPLVAATLAASDATEVAVKVTAVEKNPHAAMTLRQRQRREWHRRVEVAESDIRALPARARFDVVVSELLGGFGDNELSPECLRGVARLLRPGGISIPARSTSYLAPVQCDFLWAAAGRRPDGLDIPSGVHLDRAELLSDYAPCFSFEHPEDPADDLRRAVELEFKVSQSGVVHGFAGTFDAALDDEEVFGNHPGARVSVLQGWSPLFFPLRQPARVQKGETIRIAMWRDHDAHRVWYAWALLAPEAGPLQNARGQAASLAY